MVYRALIKPRPFEIGSTEGYRGDTEATISLKIPACGFADERGGCVITLFHSNSERGYLWNVMREKLEKEVKEEWEKVRNEEGAKRGLSEQIQEMLKDESVEVVISERDRDPYGIVILDETAVEGQRIDGSGGA